MAGNPTHFIGNFFFILETFFKPLFLWQHTSPIFHLLISPYMLAPPLPKHLMLECPLLFSLFRWSHPVPVALKTIYILMFPKIISPVLTAPLTFWSTFNISSWISNGHLCPKLNSWNSLLEPLNCFSVFPISFVNRAIFWKLLKYFSILPFWLHGLHPI